MMSLNIMFCVCKASVTSFKSKAVIPGSFSYNYLFECLMLENSCITNSFPPLVQVFTTKLLINLIINLFIFNQFCKYSK